MKNWQDTSLDDKKQMLQQVGKVFEYIYETVPEIVFFTPEEERAKRRTLGLNEDAPINAAYYQNGKIHFNEERLQSSDNFFVVSVMFHEGTHHRQHLNNFDNSLVRRIFDSNLTNVNVYENEINNRDRDLYTMCCPVNTIFVPLLRRFQDPRCRRSSICTAYRPPVQTPDQNKSAAAVSPSRT